jgi:hypothetical protein
LSDLRPDDVGSDSAANAVEGAHPLRDAGLHKIDAILEADRRNLVRVLNESVYARYDGSTADHIRAAADLPSVPQGTRGFRTMGADWRSLSALASGSSESWRR